MPPQAGFVSEWYVFQTVFQGFHLDTLAARLTLALAGAGLALTAAVAFATYVKAFGVGLLGRSSAIEGTVPKGTAVSVGLLGLCVLSLAVGMPFWLNSLAIAVDTSFGTNAAQAMHDGLLLVPLTAKFAFISPTLLVIVMPLLSLLPIVIVLINHRYATRSVPVWYGGLAQNPERVSTTALTFSNALRTFYSFIYRPTQQTERETHRVRYYVRRLTFTHDVAPIFGPYLFAPITRYVYRAAGWLRLPQLGTSQFLSSSNRCALDRHSRSDVDLIESAKMWTYVAIAVGGTIGCWARYGMTNLVQIVYGRDFPYATMSIKSAWQLPDGFPFHRDIGAASDIT